MYRIRESLARLVGYRGRARRDRELDREIAAHLQMAIDDRAGRDEPRRRAGRGDPRLGGRGADEGSVSRAAGHAALGAISAYGAARAMSSALSLSSHSTR